MKQFAEHNRVGLCHALRSDEMYKRVFSGGYPYINNDTIVRSSSSQPIYSYGKNYEKFDSKFAMFVWTTDENENSIKDRFDTYLDGISEEQVEQILDSSSFIYID